MYIVVSDNKLACDGKPYEIGKKYIADGTEKFMAYVDISSAVDNDNHESKKYFEVELEKNASYSRYMNAYYGKEMTILRELTEEELDYPLRHCAKIRDKYNFFDKEYKPIFERWFDYLLHMRNGMTVVGYKNGNAKKFNMLNSQCEYVFDIWFDAIYSRHSFNEGWSTIGMLNGNDYILSADGTYERL